MKYKLTIRKYLRKYLLGIFISFSTIIILIFFAEIIIRLAYPWFKNYDLEMWRYAAYAKKVSDHLLISHQHRPNSYFKDLYGVEVKINSKGLRDYEYTYNKSKDVYRILVLGDSITFGWGVNFNDTFCKVLEKNLNDSRHPLRHPLRHPIRYEVINSGVGNYQLLEELNYLKIEGLKYKPDY
ncbi:MAG: hypothetical protein HQK51_20805, partial [Oligoflexia bacterium]|nr:hypothetical protein [Oligoflexia bacterium]